MKSMEQLAAAFVRIEVKRGMPTKNVTEKSVASELAVSKGATMETVRVSTTLFSKEAYASYTTMANGVYGKILKLCNDSDLLPTRKWPEVEQLKVQAEIDLENIKNDLRGRYEALKDAAKAARGAFHKDGEFPEMEDWLSKFKLEIRVSRFNPKGGESSLMESLEKAVREEAETTAKTSMKLVFDTFVKHLKRIKDGAVGGLKEGGKRAVLHSSWMEDLTALTKDLEDFVEIPQEAKEKIDELAKMDKETVRENREKVTEMVNDLEKLMDGYNL